MLELVNKKNHKIKQPQQVFKNLQLLTVGPIGGHDYDLSCNVAKMDYQFSSDDLIFSLSHSICESSEFDVLLKGKWQEAVDRGLCKYKLNGLQTRILDGGYSLVAQVSGSTVVAIVFQTVSLRSLLFVLTCLSLFIVHQYDINFLSFAKLL